MQLDIRSCLLSLMVVYNSLTASAVSFSHTAGKYDKDEEADDEIQGKNQTKYDRGWLKEKETGPS